MARAVTPRGVEFDVRRRVLAWRPEFRWDLLEADDLIGVLLVIPLAFVFGAVLFPFEVVLCLVCTLLMTLGKAVRLFNWRVSARSREGLDLRWKVRGFGAAGRQAEQVRAEIASGADPSRHADRRNGRRRIGSGDGGPPTGGDWTDDDSGWGGDGGSDGGWGGDGGGDGGGGGGGD